MRVLLVLVLTSVLADAQTTMLHTNHGSGLMYEFMMVSHHAAFELLDANNDSSITLDELEVYYAKYDNLGNGRITLDEFVNSTGMDKMMARNEFNVIDEDKDGVLTIVDIRDLYKTFDVYRNNSVTEQQFINRYGEIMKIAHQGMNIG
ncbi:uncharacterized protein LOC124272861 [Haliotis rubra]|uniref:uncharacterized protein LOC124272861 n=1 Tax=Haliotis rubra TaxID=36100 RepID=UPI001EE5C427|nr:uncharacterized protein LOC124272861 [Haliotis rubra]XP_046564041.1 uncharacterized protein LOC124272861 [Haliotis rubra]